MLPVNQALLENRRPASQDELVAMDVTGVERASFNSWLALAKAREAFLAWPWGHNELDICEIPAIVVASHLTQVHEDRWQREYDKAHFCRTLFRGFDVGDVTSVMSKEVW